MNITRRITWAGFAAIVAITALLSGAVDSSAMPPPPDASFPVQQPTQPVTVITKTSTGPTWLLLLVAAVAIIATLAAAWWVSAHRSHGARTLRHA